MCSELLPARRRISRAIRQKSPVTVPYSINSFGGRRLLDDLPRLLRDDLAASRTGCLNRHALQFHDGQSDALANDLRMLTEDLNQSQRCVRRFPSTLLPTLQCLAGNAQQFGKYTLRHRHLISQCGQCCSVDLRGSSGTSMFFSVSSPLEWAMPSSRPCLSRSNIGLRDLMVISFSSCCD